MGGGILGYHLLPLFYLPTSYTSSTRSAFMPLILADILLSNTTLESAKLQLDLLKSPRYLGIQNISSLL